MLIKYTNVNFCQDHQKYVAVILDEMHIREDLVYGFCNMGNINNYLLEFERCIVGNSIKPDLAKSMLVFMVRGLFTPLEFPYAQFSTKDLTGELIFNPFWNVVYSLERLGLKVISATEDGASPNRSFFKMNYQQQPKHQLHQCQCQPQLQGSTYHQLQRHHYQVLPQHHCQPNHYLTTNVKIHSQWKKDIFISFLTLLIF